MIVVYNEDKAVQFNMCDKLWFNHHQRITSYYMHCLCLCSIAATQKAAQAKITVEDQIKAIQEAQGLL